MATPLIPFTLAWLIGIWLASCVALPTLALGVAAIVAVVGIILTWRALKPRWIFILTLAAMLGALRYNLAQPHFDQTTLATYNDQSQSVNVYSILPRPRVTVLTHDQGFAPLAWLYSFKARAIAQTLRVPQLQASLLTGILLGDDAATRRRHSQECARRFPCDRHIPYRGVQRPDAKPDVAFVISGILSTEKQCA